MDRSLSQQGGGGGGGGGGLNCNLLVPNLCPNSAVVEVQEMFSSHGSLLTIAMYHQRETLKSNLHTMMKQRIGFTSHRAKDWDQSR